MNQSRYSEKKNESYKERQEMKDVIFLKNTISKRNILKGDKWKRKKENVWMDKWTINGGCNVMSCRLRKNENQVNENNKWTNERQR